MFFQQKKTLENVIFVQSSFKLDPNPHLKSSWILIRLAKNGWIRIRQKMNADSQAAWVTQSSKGNSYTNGN